MSVEEIVAASTSRIEGLLEPINGGVGEDVSYDEKFEEIKAEAEKLQSLSGEKINWGNLSAAAQEVLEDKSKDFRVCCYWGAAQIATGGPEGVLDAMMLVKEFAEKFWDDGYPPLRRIRARAGMLAWMSDRAKDIRDQKFTPQQRDLVDAIDVESRALDGNFREKFGDSYPGISEIRESSRFWIRIAPKKEEPKPEPEKKPDEPAPAAQAGQAAPPPPPAPVPRAPAGDGPPTNPAAITDGATALKAVPQVGRLLAKMGAMMRQTKPEDPLAYRFGRMGMWLELDDAPPATDNKTLVPPPPENLKQRFDGLAAADDWLTLINEADDAAATFILWLDPHRYIATAMDRLGALFLKAKDALLIEVALMLKRIPTLPKLEFNTGVPLADGQTVMWLESQVAAVLGGEEGGGGGGAGGEASALDEPIEEARDLAVKGKLPEAVLLLSRATASAPTPADGFRGKLALAQLCLQAGQYSVARAQLDGLTHQIDEHRLRTWQPALCGEVYAALYAAHKGANEGGEIPAEAMAAQAAAFEQLCQLDAAAALKLGGDTKG